MQCMTESILYQSGATLRSNCGRARLTYHPEWDATLPWVSYKNGTAGRHFGSLGGGVQQLTRDGYRFSKPFKVVP